MRLVRLTSEDDFGNFDTKFDTDIVIKKGQQIALQSASFSEQINTLSLDSTNNEMSFQFKSGTQIDIVLNEADYTNINKQDLFDDITNKLNAGLVFASGKAIGLNFLAELDKTSDKVNIGYARSDFQQAFARINEQQAEFSQVAGADAMETLTTKLQSKIGDTTDDRCKYASMGGWAATGGGMMWRLRVSDFNRNGSGVDDNGFTMGLSATPPSNWINKTTMSADEKAYAVHFKRDNENIFTKTLGQNAFQDSGVQPGTLDATGASDNNDVFEWSISENNLRCIHYKLTNPVDPAGGTTATTLVNIPYVQGTRLYPYLILHGGVNSCKVRQVVHTIDPFAPPVLAGSVGLKHDDNHPDVDLNTMLGAVDVPNTGGGTGNTDNILSMSVALQEFFGYDANTIFFSSGPITVFTAENIFIATLSNVSFMIELRNIQVDSYNSDTGQRQNIIAVIPQQTSGAKGIIEYEPNNLYFIDILQETLIRNFTARILRIDGSRPKLSGISVLTLLIKDP